MEKISLFVEALKGVSIWSLVAVGMISSITLIWTPPFHPRSLRLITLPNPHNLFTFCSLLTLIQDLFLFPFPLLFLRCPPTCDWAGQPFASPLPLRLTHTDIPRTVSKGSCHPPYFLHTWPNYILTFLEKSKPSDYLAHFKVLLYISGYFEELFGTLVLSTSRYFEVF